jgi:hypothetical protein
MIPPKAGVQVMRAGLWQAHPCLMGERLHEPADVSQFAMAIVSMM